jgi:hypothetical protein
MMTIRQSPDGEPEIDWAWTADDSDWTPPQIDMERPSAARMYDYALGGKDNFDGKSACTTTAEAHVSTAMLPATFEYTGNLDNADYVAPDTKVLVKCKWSGAAPKDKETAVSWYRTAGKGRVFYTNFAKVDGDISDATFGQKHILVGLGWTLGR